MSPQIAKKRIEKLELLSERLRRDLERLEEDVSAAQRQLAEEAKHDDDIAEVAALALGRDQELSREEQVKNLLEKVENALAAVETGAYGRCESCGRRIPRERLDAVPWASKCVECKRREEKR